MILTIRETELKLPEFRGLYFRIETPNIQDEFEDIDGGGKVDLGSLIKESPISVSFKMLAKDYQDSIQQKNYIKKLVISENSYFIGTSQESGKRWRVKFKEINFERLSRRLHTVTVNYTCLTSLAESIGTTLDPLTFEVEKWQTGQGLTTENPIYEQQATTFRIFNAGDVAIDPRQMPLRIEFKKSSSNLKITNHTTGDVWQYNGSSGANDTIILDGIRSLKNGASIFKDTNKKLITIAPGWNDFEITGASDFLITFDFRFYYF